MVPFLIKTLLYDFIQFAKFIDTLLQNMEVILMKLDSMLVPPFADPALVGVFPYVTMLDSITPKNSGEDDFAHVISHWILQQQVICDFIYANEEESYFTRGLIFCLGEGILLYSFPNSLDLEAVLQEPLVFDLVGVYSSDKVSLGYVRLLVVAFLFALQQTHGFEISNN